MRDLCAEFADRLNVTFAARQMAGTYLITSAGTAPFGDTPQRFTPSGSF